MDPTDSNSVTSPSSARTSAEKVDFPKPKLSSLDAKIAETTRINQTHQTPSDIRSSVTPLSAKHQTLHMRTVSSKTLVSSGLISAKQAETEVRKALENAFILVKEKDGSLSYTSVYDWYLGEAQELKATGGSFEQKQLEGKFLSLCCQVAPDPTGKHHGIVKVHSSNVLALEKEVTVSGMIFRIEVESDASCEKFAKEVGNAVIWYDLVKQQAESQQSTVEKENESSESVVLRGKRSDEETSSEHPKSGKVHKRKSDSFESVEGSLSTLTSLSRRKERSQARAEQKKDDEKADIDREIIRSGLKKEEVRKSQVNYLNGRSPQDSI